MQQPPLVDLPALRAPSQPRANWAQELVSATKATMYMLASCMEIESSYTPAARAMDAMRNLRRLMHEVGSLPALDAELVRWAARLLRRVELESRMVSAMEAQDVAGAQQLLDVAERHEVGVLGEIVKHTQRMIQNLTQEEAALFASLRVRHPTLPQESSSWRERVSGAETLSAPVLLRIQASNLRVGAETANKTTWRQLRFSLNSERFRG